jgi:hypothetical protein
LVEAHHPWLLVRYAAAAACPQSKDSHVTATDQAPTGGIAAHIILGRGGESTGSKCGFGVASATARGIYCWLNRWQAFLVVAPEWQTVAAAARAIQGVSREAPLPPQISKSSLCEPACTVRTTRTTRARRILVITINEAGGINQVLADGRESLAS